MHRSNPLRAASERRFTRSIPRTSRWAGSLGNEVVGDKRPTPEAVEEKDGVVCEAWLGGLLRHYRRAAA